jgi:hypothetical protein
MTNNDAADTAVTAAASDHSSTTTTTTASDDAPPPQKKRGVKEPRLSDEERKAIYYVVRRHYHDGVLRRGAIAEVAKIMMVSVNTVRRIWNEALLHMVDGHLPDPSVLHTKKVARGPPTLYSVEETCAQIERYKQEGYTNYYLLEKQMGISRRTLRRYEKKREQSLMAADPIQSPVLPPPPARKQRALKPSREPRSTLLLDTDSNPSDQAL